MGKLGPVGNFCPNPESEQYGEVEAQTIIRYGKTEDGQQRFQGKNCGQTFNERKGTLSYQRKTAGRSQPAKNYPNPVNFSLG